MNLSISMLTGPGPRQKEQDPKGQYTVCLCSNFINQKCHSFFPERRKINKDRESLKVSSNTVSLAGMDTGRG